MPFPIYNGNCPENVARDAKYSVRLSSGTPVIGLRYEADEEEVWLLSTNKHPLLVEMVNAVKIEYGNAPNGTFYINEYKQVIVPVPNNQNYYLAGTYREPLYFEFEGKIISGNPLDFDGNPLSIGDKWIGPHPGIPYILCAGGKDIRYEVRPRPNVIRRIILSSFIGNDQAAEVAEKIVRIKGSQGGRFYVNEFRAIFTPVQEGIQTSYFYVGNISLNRWFPKT